MKIKAWIFYASENTLALNIDFGQPIAEEDALRIIQQRIAPFPTTQPPPDYDYLRAGCVSWPFQWSEIPGCVRGGRYWGPEIKYVLRMRNGVVRAVIEPYGHTPARELLRIALPGCAFGAEAAPDEYATFLELSESEAT
jgi:hypothetical protein